MRRICVVITALAALARGAKVVEVHVALHRRAFGPDVTASLLPDQLALLAQARDAFVTMDEHPVNKDRLAGELQQMREYFSKSVCVKHPMPAGARLSRDDLMLKKPGTGIASDKIGDLIGKTLIRDVSQNRLLEWGDVDD